MTRKWIALALAASLAGCGPPPPPAAPPTPAAELERIGRELRALRQAEWGWIAKAKRELAQLTGELANARTRLLKRFARDGTSREEKLDAIAGLESRVEEVADRIRAGEAAISAKSREYVELKDRIEKGGRP